MPNRTPFRAIGASLALHLAAALWLAWRTAQPQPAPIPPPVVVQLLRVSGRPPLRSPAALALSPQPRTQLKPQGVNTRRTPPSPLEATALAPTEPDPAARGREGVSPSAAPPAIEEAQTAPAEASETATAPPAPSYVAELARRLAQVKRYPDLARRRRERGAVLLRFQLDRNGHLLTASVDQTSGFQALDQEVLRMVSQAAPFAPFPSSMGGDKETFLVSIDFSLR